MRMAKLIALFAKFTNAYKSKHHFKGQKQEEKKKTVEGPGLVFKPHTAMICDGKKRHFERTAF